MRSFFLWAGAVAAIIVAAAAAAVFFFMISKKDIADGPDMERTYTQISMDEARAMMEKDDGHIVVDVRRVDEYEEGHIPGAICIPNEEIGDKKPDALPDTDQIILVYCRSGRRSKEASQKLFDMGYTNVYEFGGILDWTWETETGGAQITK